MICSPSTSTPFALGARPMRFAAVLLAAFVACGVDRAAAKDGAVASDPRDAGAFVEGLAELELGGVIDRLLQHPPADPEEAKPLRDALAGRWLPKQATSVSDFLAGVEGILAYDRKMPRPGEGPVYWAEPIWGADLAQTLLFEALPALQDAGDFVLLGVPTEGQLRATTKIAADAHERLMRADNQFLRIKLSLRRQRDFVSEYVNTGRWDRLKGYMGLNVPYYRAWSAAFLAVQGTEGPYYAGVEDAAGERARLLSAATGDVRALVDRRERLPLNDDNLARLDILSALLAIERGESEAAKEAAARAAGQYPQATDYTKFLARLTRAKALQAAGESEAAADVLLALRDDAFTHGHPLRMILVADRRFLRIKSQAEAMAAESGEARAERLADAFAVYQELLESEPAQQWVEPMRGQIEGRYERQVPSWARGELLPPTVRFAAARRDYREAENLSQQGKGEQAMALYRRVVEETRALLKGEQLGYAPAFEADIRFYQALAMLRSGDSINALDGYLLIAEKFPNLRQGERAIRIAYLNILRPAYRRRPDNAKLVARLEKAFDILFAKYPGLPLTDTARYHYAAFLREQERYREAVSAYAKIGPSHENYLPARYEELVSRAALWSAPPEGADPTDKQFPGHPETVYKAASEYIELAEQRLQSTERDRREQTLRRHLAEAHLIRAQLSLQARNDAEAAEQELDRVATRYGDLEGMENRITHIRIRTLQSQGRYVEAERLLRQYMERSPEEAAPLAAGVLKGLADEARRRAARGEPVDQIVDAVVKLADSLVLPWARQQPFTAPQKIAFELRPAKAQMLARRWDKALQRLNAILERYKQPAQRNLDVVMGKARCQYELGELNAAFEGFTKIYKSYLNSDAAADGGAMPPQFWEAALHMVRIMDQRADGKNPDIYYWIEQREARQGGLGGERFREAFIELQAKHRP